MEDFADQVARKTREARQAETVRKASEAAEKAAVERAIRRMNSAATTLAAVLPELGIAPQCELVAQRYERTRWRHHYTYHRETMAVGWLIAFTWSAVTDVGTWVDGEILTTDGRVLVFGHMHGSITDLTSPAQVVHSPGHSSESLCEAGRWDISDPSMSEIYNYRGRAEQITQHLADLAVRHRINPTRLRSVD